MSFAVREKTVRLLSTTVILWCAPGLIAYGAMVAISPLMSEGAWSTLAIPIFAPASLVFMWSAVFLIVMHLSMLTTAVSLFCLAASLPRALRHEWSRWTLALASVSLLGHLGLLLYPAPPHSTWLQRMGLWFGSG